MFICHGFNFTRLDEEFWCKFLLYLFFTIGIYFGAMLGFQSGRPKTNYLLCTRESPAGYLHLPERTLAGTQYLLAATVINYFFTTINIWMENKSHDSRHRTQDDNISVASLVLDPVISFRRIEPLKKVEVIRDSFITNFVFFSICFIGLILTDVCYSEINIFKFNLGNSTDTCVYYIHHGMTQHISIIFLLKQFIR